MAARHYWNAGIITTLIAVVTTVVSVSGQTSNCSRNGCSKPKNLPKTVSFILTGNYEKVYDNSTHCFPFNTTLLYVCKLQEHHQFTPAASVHNLLSRKCTGSGWLDDNGLGEQLPPKCEARKKQCFWPPVPISSNVFVQIDSRNISIEDGDEKPRRSYSENTIATYKCMNPKSPDLNKVEQIWRCTKEKDKNKKWTWIPFATDDSWKWMNLTAKDLHCDAIVDIPESTDDYSAAKTTSSINRSIITETSFTTFVYNDFAIVDDTNHQQTTSRNIIIGVCGAVALVLIAILVGLCHKNRLTFGKRYDGSAIYASQPSLALIIEEQSKCNQTHGHNLLYANIIPIKVNSETIYTEVETGSISRDRNLGGTVKGTIPDDRIQTIYAEIHHPA